jgi:serine/threonine protein kinase
VSQTRKARRATHHTFAEGLSEFKILRIIGQGTFGRVKLAQHKPTSQVMAMKCLQKQQIWKQKQVTNVLNEKDAMEHIDHPFVLKLLGTYQDTDQLYFFLEIVHGGELWSLLYQSRALPRVCSRSNSSLESLTHTHTCHL